MSSHKQLKGGIGITYIITNALYEKNKCYKFGITNNPIERLRVQSNFVPPIYPLYKKLFFFSPHYKELEKELEYEFKNSGILLNPDNTTSTEWIQCDNFEIVKDICSELLFKYDKTTLIFGGKSHTVKDGVIKVGRLPKCRLDLLGLGDGAKISCTVNGKQFIIRDNGILVNGNVLTVSSYVKSIIHRNGGKCTQEFNGFQYFTYKGQLIYNLWQSLVKV